MSDGTRTRGHLDHNQVLYQLSYTHHARSKPTGRRKGYRVPEGARAPVFRDPLHRGRSACYPAGSTYFAAMDRAVSESGPGCGTKTASR